jgi:hypothetical protein
MSQYDPYQSPQFVPPQLNKPGFGAPKPSVVTWYQVYCGAMMALYIAVAIGGTALFLNIDNLPEINGEDRIALQIQSVVYVVIAIPLTIFFLIGLMVPRKRWGWIYAIVAIGLGLTSCCTWPATIPLLIYWLKPETKAYFEM